MSIFPRFNVHMRCVLTVGPVGPAGPARYARSARPASGHRTHERKAARNIDNIIALRALGIKQPQHIAMGGKFAELFKDLAVCSNDAERSLTAQCAAAQHAQAHLE